MTGLSAHVGITNTKQHGGRMISWDALDQGKITEQDKTFISDTLERLQNAPMTPTAHGYQGVQNETILDALRRSKKNRTRLGKASPAIAIMSVILAANRNYNRQVAPHVERMQRDYANMTLKELDRCLATNHTAEQFKNIWGHNDSRKLQTLKDLLKIIIPRLDQHDNVKNDYDVVSKWANDACHLNNADPILKIRYIGIATFQHLRITFGANTVKPDQRVKEVLTREFGLEKLSDIKSITAVERLATNTGTCTWCLDQVFVKYGSGHYASNRTTPINNDTRTRSKRTQRMCRP